MSVTIEVIEECIIVSMRGKSVGLRRVVALDRGYLFSVVQRGSSAFFVLLLFWGPLLPKYSGSGSSFRSVAWCIAREVWLCYVHAADVETVTIYLLTLFAALCCASWKMTLRACIVV